MFGSVAGGVVCTIALVRRRDRLWTAAAGLTVAAAAVLVSWVADLPAEPGPAMTLALAVLVGAGVRQLEPRPAGAVAAGGAAVAAAWLPEGGVSRPPEVLSTVYRIAQEALTNVTRHAPQAGTVTVDVAQGEDMVTVEVSDDAAHPPARQPSGDGFGLVGMRERVEALGGTFHAGARRGAGWSVVASLPLASGAGM